MKKKRTSRLPRTKTLLVDDHSIVRQGLRRLLESEPDFEVCGEAPDGPAALTLASIHKPDIAVVDIGLEGMNGLDLIKNLKERRPGILILVVSMYDEQIYAERALRAGAKGYLMKKESAEKIVGALRKIREGKLFLSEAVKEKILDRVGGSPLKGEKNPVDRLSDRELEVFQLIGRGFKTGEVAGKLNLGIKTVESYREQIKIKLALESASELVRYAIGWVHNSSS